MKHVAAIDVGGTKILGALVTENGEILKELRVPSEFARGGRHILSKIFELIDTLQQTDSVDAIGIGIGGRIDTEKGVINWGVKPVPDYYGLEVKKLTEQRYGIPCAVENDVKVAGYGEQWMGAGRDADSYVCITIGTGLGGAVSFGGEMLHGAHWSGGELGHIILHPNGRQCTCGLKGCVEQYLCGTALVSIYNEKAPEKISTGYEFFDRVRMRDAAALEVLDAFVDDLYNLLLTIFNGFDPQRVIIGGGLIDTRDLWWEALEKKLAASPIHQVFAPVVVPAELGNKAGYYGAAYLALKLLEQPI